MSSVRTIHLPPLESLKGQSRRGRKRERAEASAGGQASLLEPGVGAVADPLKLVWTFADCIGDLEQLRGLIRALATEGSQRYGTLVVACRAAKRLTERLEQLRDADNQLAKKELGS